MIHMVFCEICANNLSKCGEPALCLFEEICIHTTIYDEFLELEEDRAIIRFLELKGFIITTEVNQDKILAKPIGLELYDDEEFCFFHVCVDRLEHDYALDR